MEFSWENKSVTIPPFRMSSVKNYIHERFTYWPTLYLTDKQQKIPVSMHLLWWLCKVFQRYFIYSYYENTLKREKVQRHSFKPVKRK